MEFCSDCTNTPLCEMTGCRAKIGQALGEQIESREEAGRTAQISEMEAATETKRFLPENAMQHLADHFGPKRATPRPVYNESLNSLPDGDIAKILGGAFLLGLDHKTASLSYAPPSEIFGYLGLTYNSMSAANRLAILGAYEAGYGFRE